jgi:hypothetical protein
LALRLLKQFLCQIFILALTFENKFVIIISTTQHFYLSPFSLWKDR